MAYVGTPTRLGDARTTLASIIQGEAGGEGLRGMQAVGQVISNRAAQNYGGYGSDLVSQATARMQFQGQATRISPQAYQVADQALAGQLPNVVGPGAVNYANPGDSTARWARNLNSSNSFQLGNHYFTDNTRGIPYAGPGNQASFAPANTNDPLQYTGPSGFQTAGVPGVTSGNGVETSVGTRVMSESYTADHGEVVFGNDDGVANTGQAIGGTQGITASSFTSANVAGDAKAGSFGLGGITSNGQTVGSGNGGPGGTSDPVVGYNSAGPVIGAPTVTAAINQSGAKVSGSVDKGAKQIGDDTKTAGKTIGDSITGAAKTAQAISKSWQDLGTDYFVRLVFIVFGLIALAAALMMFKPVQNVVGSVVPAGRAIKAANKLKRAIPG